MGIIEYRAKDASRVIEIWLKCALAVAIGGKKITAIYSLDRGRNRETIQLLETHLGVIITLIPEARLSNTRRPLQPVAGNE